MKRRLLIANLIVVSVVLIILEVPLAIIFSRHEHDAVATSLQRDAGSLAALSEEVIEHRGDHDIAALAQRFSAGRVVLIVDGDGNALTSRPVEIGERDYARMVELARAKEPDSGEVNGLGYVTAVVGSDNGANNGAVVIASSDAAIDRRVRRFWMLLAGVGMAVVAVSVVVSNRLGRWVADPLERLDERAARFGGGDLDTRADTSDGPPEVVTLAITFNEMADRLDELVSSQRRFVADASHQLRTPLTALRLRLENLDPDEPEAIATTRDAALDETGRLTRLVDGLLSLARAEGHRPGRTLVDVTATLGERQEAWSPLAIERGVQLSIAAHSQNSLCLALVPGHLDQILDNLIDNALDASSTGGTIELRANATSGGAEIHVIDHGRGMSEPERQRAFDPFWQNPDGHSNGSAGLGLAIADQLARACRGSITLEQTSGGGTDAVIRFGNSPNTVVGSQVPH